MRQIAMFGAMAGLPMSWTFGCGEQGQDDAQSKAEQAREEFDMSLQDTGDGPAKEREPRVS